MTLKQRLDKKRLIKHLVRELEFIWRYDWAKTMFDKRCDDERVVKRYNEANLKVKQLESLLIERYGKNYILH